MITTICYGKEQTWLSRQMAIDTFTEAMLSTEGSERDRYATIVSELEAGKDVATDEGERYCPRLSEHQKYLMLLNWVFDMTDTWLDLVHTLADCGFTASEVLEMASDECWANSSEEEREIMDVVKGVYGWA